MNNHLILIGFMGSGKSSVARALAEELNAPLYDLDTIFETEQGMTIPEFFEENDEKAFREIELTILEATLAKPSGIISTGGGVIVQDTGRQLLQESAAEIVWLKIDFETIGQRMAEEDLNKRPLLKKGPEQIAKLFKERQPLYQSTATMTVDGNADVKTIVEEIEQGRYE